MANSTRAGVLVALATVFGGVLPADADAQSRNRSGNRSGVSVSIGANVSSYQHPSWAPRSGHTTWHRSQWSHRSHDRHIGSRHRPPVVVCPPPRPPVIITPRPRPPVVVCPPSRPVYVHPPRPVVFHAPPPRVIVYERPRPQPVVVYGSPRPEPIYVPPPEPDTMETGWNALARGDAQRALRIFSSFAESQPHRALPKVGYALACSALGDDRAAVSAMRRAFRTDPEGVHYLPKTDGIHDLLNRLEHRYRDHSRRFGESPDPHFMLGAVLFLGSHYEEALIAVSRAEDRRDRDDSTRILREAIQQHHPDYGVSNGGNPYDLP